MIYLNRIHHPVTTLGYGSRVGVWFQGCSIHCPGCVVPDTWVAGEQHCVPLEWVQRAVAPLLDRSDGITVSGGEPFDQPESLMALLTWVKGCFKGDILVYSGYPEESLRDLCPGVFRLADVLVVGPYEKRLPDDRPFIGSSNQRLLLLTDLARERYRDPERMAVGFGVDVVGNEILLTGVPGRGFMKDFRRRLTDVGLQVRNHG
jgi:anaerobic ribonucleoside-triphosphate reductase activating protein